MGTAPEFGSPDLVVIPGSKTTVADLDWLRSAGLAERIVAARRAGVPVVGICAGYQMLGETLSDPRGVESPRPSAPGLGLLAVSTTFSTEKATHQTRVRVIGGHGLLEGCRGVVAETYEIRMGVTSGEGSERPFLIERRSGRTVNLADGALDGEGLTLGAGLHGLFHNRALRRSILENAARRRSLTLPRAGADLDPNAEYDKLASWARRHLDMDLIHRMTGLESPRLRGSRLVADPP